jgi:DNA-binding response OmpR family regulator
MRILVIENELPLAGHITRTLARCGHSLSAQPDGPLGLQTALAQRPDLVVVDLQTVRGRSCTGQIRRIRSASRVLLLTGRSGADPRFSGAPSGTTDVLAKPFTMTELVNRVEVLGRKVPTDAGGGRLEVADLRLEVRRRLIERAGKTTALPRRECELLEILMREPGRVFSRTEICERIWQRDHAYGSRTVEIFISRLRQKVARGSLAPLSQTVRAVGYAIGAPGCFTRVPTTQARPRRARSAADRRPK